MESIHETLNPPEPNFKLFSLARIWHDGKMRMWNTPEQLQYNITDLAFIKTPMRFSKEKALSYFEGFGFTGIKRITFFHS
jgi:hypothetical protein